VTYSIVARDPATGELGVAVQSRAFGAGRVVPWALSGVGAVATQAFGEKSYGPRGLDLMAQGRAPADALAELLEADGLRESRQVAFLAADGRSAVHTGAACIPEAGHLVGEDFCAQGNMLRSPDVWPAMAEAFSRAVGTLAERLLDALDAAEAAGGDFRGRQAAGLLVVAGESSGKPWDDVLFDVRVDDHPEPLAEVRRLHRMAVAYRRRNRIGPGASVDEEIEAAREAGLPEQDVALAGALAAAASADLERAASLLAPLVAEERRWLELLERYERMGLVPPGVLELLS
jgi:uncharacterized Ntn-hydrolase superfamily protein